MKKYFLHIEITRDFGHEEEEFFFSGNDLSDIFHEMMSTVRYYASTENYADAWQADAEVFNDDTGTYLCSLTAAAYNKGIKVFRDEGEMDFVY